MKSVLALDVSSVATGWAFGWPGEKPTSGVHRFASKSSLDDEIWLAALRWTTDQINVLSPDVIAIEAAIMSTRPTGAVTNAHTQGLLWGLQAVIRTVVKAKRPGIAKQVNVQAARKIFTGRGTYPKGEAKTVVRARCIELGWVEPDEKSTDRCDALCVWAKACADIDPAFASKLTPLFSEAA